MSSKKIAILYGSETGNCHDFATILSHKLHRLHFQHTISSLGDYIAKDILQCRYLFIICSTTGQGNLPRNAHQPSKDPSLSTLWSFLKKKNLPSDLLNHLKVFMLGLGDSSYPKFNFAIRKLHRRIVLQLGAIELFPRLEADELGLAGSNNSTGTGVESVYFEFEKRILNFLLEKFPNRKVDGKTVKRVRIPDDTYLKPPSVLQIGDNNLSATDNVAFHGDSTIKTGKVVLNKRITHQEHFQDVRQFVVESNGEEYQPGDTLSIYPFNSDTNVQEFLDLQPHWLEVADKPLSLSDEQIAMSEYFQDGGLVSPLTLRNILKYHCDIMSIPRKSFFMKIWTFATDVTRLPDGEEQLEQQREKLHQFATDEDMQDLYDYCNRPRRSILEVVKDFESLKLPLEYVLDYIPQIKPRFFSISSGPCERNIELTIAVVKYRTILRRIRKGLCTDYIISLSGNDKIRYKLQRNFLLNSSMKGKPIIMISPGVGLAPMMSLIRSGFFEDMHLFFGNRIKSKDFLYREDLEKWNDSNIIKLYTCFSRDPQNSPEAKYVQDVLWKHGKELGSLLAKKSAMIYICGSSGKMPVQVRLTIVEILKKWGGFENHEAAKVYLKDMEKSSRYLQETW